MSSIVNSTGVAISTVPKVSGVIPTGSSLLVELLTDQELTSSTLLIQGSTVGGPPQAYVLAIGPGLSGVENAPIRVGDRVILSGNGCFVPRYDESPRTRLLVEVHNVKGIIIEVGKEDQYDVGPAIGPGDFPDPDPDKPLVA